LLLRWDDLRVSEDESACPEHVWGLTGMVTEADGRIGLNFGCERCPASKYVSADDADTSGSPDLPT
jgi:hypothetical protein